MSERISHLDSEFDMYIENLKGWIGSVQAMKCPESRKGVVERFVRDCNILIEDLGKTTTPQSHDLIDFADRHNSLDTQYYILVRDLK